MKVERTFSAEIATQPDDVFLAETFGSFLIADFVIGSSIITFAGLAEGEGIMTGSALITRTSYNIVFASENYY